MLKGRPGKAVVQHNARNAELMDAYELDIATGDLTLLAENPGTVISWISGPSGDLFTNTLTADGDIEVSQWDSATSSLRPIKVYEGRDYPLGIYPVAVAPDGTGLWLGSYEGSERLRLARLDVASGEEIEVDTHPTFDLGAQIMLPSPFILSEQTGELIGARYYGERQVIHALDDDFAEVLAALTNLSDGDLAGMSCDDSGQRWVVSFTQDRDPGLTYFYDHSTGESRLLFQPFPHLDPAALAPMTPVTITARDGLPLHSYLTLPVGVPPENLPLVLLVHGGPWARDYWGFQPDVQLLANRGYAVLQVNFRGSTGFGKSFTQAAIGEFAGRMHDDLIDAVDWAVKQGTPTATGSRSSAGPTAGTPRWSASRSPRTCSPRPSTTSGSPVCPTSCGPCPTSPAGSWPATGTSTSAILRIRNRRPICWPVPHHQGGSDPHPAACGAGRQRHSGGTGRIGQHGRRPARPRRRG